MTQGQRRRLATIFFFFLIPIFLISTSLAACPTIFYAKQIDYSELKKIDFYHTQLNVQSASECANDCGKKQFCRIAVYNHESKTCAFSFDTMIDCIKSRERFNDFYLTSTASTPLSLVACIDRCKKGELNKPLDFAHEKSGEEFEKSENSEHSPKFSVRITTPKDSDKIDLITSPTSDEAFNPQPIVITEDDLKNANKSVKMIPHPLGVEGIAAAATKASSSADGSHSVNLNEVVRQIQNFTVVKKNGGTVSTGKIPKDKAQLITISPEEFEKMFGNDNLLKTVNTTGKIQVQGEDIEKIIETVKQQIESNQKILITKDKMDENQKDDNANPSNEKESVAEFSKPTTPKSFTTTTEPIVVNGKVLSPNAVRELVEYERTSTTTTTTPRPIILTTEEGFMNTFVLSGVGDIFKEALADRNKQGQGHLSPELSTDATSVGPASCYRTISRQLLYRAAFVKLGGRVSLNECRCACAKTWEKSETKPKCKSLQYNEATGECSLNQDDHTGKFDLVSHKDIDYHYISCELGMLLDLKERMCGGEKDSTSKSDKNEVDLNRIDSESTTPIPTSTSSEIIAKEITTPPSTYKGDESQIVKDEIPDPALTIAETDAQKAKVGPIKTKKTEANVTEKVDVMLSTTPIPPTEETTIIPITLPSIERTTVKEKINLVTGEPIVEITTAETTTAEATKTTSSNTKETIPSTPTSTKTDKTQTSTTKLSSTESSTESVTTLSPSTTTTSTTTTVSVIPKKSYEGCYEAFDGYRLTTKPGGLESDVSLEECSCFCANSRTSNRYQFQCLSALYYHKEKDCMLFIDNRQLKPEAFTLAPASDGNVTYLGMICPLSKTIETHVNPSYDFGCVKPDTSSTTPAIKTTTTAIHTDECFDEHPKYVLEGTSLAIESNVTVEECKCYCIDSESRYGSDCQSIQYYYDSQTCLLNKENQITDPENFVYDPYSDQMRSYFDYTCRSERMILSVYVEQICSTVVEIDLKKMDIGPPSLMPDNSAPNNDEKSTEIKKEHETSKEEQDDEKTKVKSTSTSTTSTTTTTTFTTTTTTTTPEPTKPPTTSAIKFNKNSNKPVKHKSKAAEIEELSGEIDEPTTISTTTQVPTTTTTSYKLVKYCERSALYQTVFTGDKLIKKLTVTNADECLSACHAEKCRSANLIHLSGVLKTCELFKDSVVDFRRTDVIYFDAGAVHFDAIKCYE